MKGWDDWWNLRDAKASLTASSVVYRRARGAQCNQSLRRNYDGPCPTPAQSLQFRTMKFIQIIFDSTRLYRLLYFSTSSHLLGHLRNLLLLDGIVGNASDISFPFSYNTTLILLKLSSSLAAAFFGISTTASLILCLVEMTAERNRKNGFVQLRSL
jgi:hypothetical protein